MLPLLRFSLDLFDQPPAPAASPPPARQQTAPQLSFRHPRANRELRLGPVLVAYEFKRGQRRSIGLSVGPDGLAVRAPKWSPLAEVDAVLQAKAAWVLRKLQASQERKTKQAEQVIDWRHGACLPYLGQRVRIELAPEHRFGAGGAELLTPHGLEPGGPILLRLNLPHHADAGQIRDHVQSWLMQQAKALFQARLNHFAPLLGVQWKKLALSNAATRWGSAKSDGSIRLNWRLIHHKPSVIDYVVAHELSHLREMNHSARFWDTVASVVPDYPALRQQLKTEASPR